MINENLTTEQQQRVEDNLLLVVSIARSFNPQASIELDDLISVGNIGLIRAAKKYKPELGWQFSTYASVVIRREILREISKNKIKTEELGDSNTPYYEDEEKVNIVISGLTPVEYKVLQMRFYEDKTFEEIGNALGFTKQWANIQYQKAINKIREVHNEKD